jgi:hypothetical protein
LVSLPAEAIAVAVRWFLRHGLSYRDVEELLAERGIEVDHVTSYRCAGAGASAADRWAAASASTPCLPARVPCPPSLRSLAPTKTRDRCAAKVCRGWRARPSAECSWDRPVTPLSLHCPHIAYRSEAYRN